MFHVPPWTSIIIYIHEDALRVPLPERTQVPALEKADVFEREERGHPSGMR
jgi:hypothetical protein